LGYTHCGRIRVSVRKIRLNPIERRRKMKKYKSKSLVVQSLENVSKVVFRNYAPLITELIGRSPGVYALYDDMGLYYVGKSVDLKGRVHHHLKDRHKASWTHFSLYLFRHEHHVDEIESLLIRIASPKGNRVKPKGRSDGSMLKELKDKVKEQQRQDLDGIFGFKSLVHKKTRKESNVSLGSLVKRNTALFRTYKGKEYKAILTPEGFIRLRGKIYKSPSSAGKSIVRHGCNGWRFWYLRNENNDIVSLDELR